MLSEESESAYSSPKLISISKNLLKIPVQTYTPNSINKNFFVLLNPDHLCNLIHTLSKNCFRFAKNMKYPARYLKSLDDCFKDANPLYISA